MKHIFIIAKKEITGIVRDKRTMVTMVVLPLLMFPLLMSVIGSFTSKQIQKEVERRLNITVIGSENGQQLYSQLQDMEDVSVNNAIDIDIADTLIKSGDMDAVIIIKPDFDSAIVARQTGKLVVKYKSSNWAAKDKISRLINNYSENITLQRLEDLGLSKEAISPVYTQYDDISTKREKFGENVGGMIPYVLLIFSYLGCMYPAIELFTNEKEKGTLETLLTTPVKRLHILFGKMAVISLTGFLSAVLSIVGLSYGLTRFANAMPSDIAGSLGAYADPKVILLLVAMLLPLVVFIAGIMTVITNYARTYKEAQSLISPLMMVLLLPAILGMLPFLELSFNTAFIPITNLALAAKAILSGNLNYAHYAIVIVSLFIYSIISVYFATIWFGKEKSILR